MVVAAEHQRGAVDATAGGVHELREVISREVAAMRSHQLPAYVGVEFLDRHTLLAPGTVRGVTPVTDKWLTC